MSELGSLFQKYNKVFTFLDLSDLSGAESGAKFLKVESALPRSESEL